MKPTATPKFFALDLDRTLCHTDAVVQRLESFLLLRQPVLARALHDDRQAIERTGGSFDIVAGLERRGATAVQDVIKQFVYETAPQGKSLLLPGAKELLAQIEGAGCTWGVLTFGGEVWQQAKVQLLGLPVERTLTVSERGIKGRLIAGWQQPDASYQLPDIFGGGHVGEVVLVDDKYGELMGLPSDGSARGYYVRRYAKHPPDGRPSELPLSVRAVETLHDIIRSEGLS